MQKNLVIVESPAKAKTIGRFLGDDFKVMSSYGHIRDLKTKAFSIDTDTFQPEYEIPEDKQQVVAALRAEAQKADQVWLASDEDREGEAISWHLAEVLGLDVDKTKRIVFHEITQNAIQEAVKSPRTIDRNLVNAQQARRVLDRIVGFKLSPVLWHKVKPALSAGRVQSVAVRLVADREKEIKEYRATSNFFHVGSLATKPVKRTPAPPFMTSTLQQEAARKLGFSVSTTMSVAQRLYESGHITYMRTDSLNLSSLCLASSKKLIAETMGEEYCKPRQFQTKAKGAQEAHEAIRPTYMENEHIKGTAQEQRLYQLIRRMGILPPLKKGQDLKFQKMTAEERFSQRPPRYNEASLVHKMEELGIGRPSTYAPIISTIQQRGYVERGNKEGLKRSCSILELKNNKIKESQKNETTGAEKNKLLPTDIGMVVNDYLMQEFPDIMDYNFTAKVERDFDSVAEGKKEWTGLMRKFYTKFMPEVDKALKTKTDLKVGERVLGTDPKTGKPVSVKIGPFGPMAQIGSATDKEKPSFAPLMKGQSLDSITLEEVLELFKLPRELGEFESHKVLVNNGRFGPYVLCNKKYVSVPKDKNIMTITLEEAIDLIEKKRQADEASHLKSFEEDPKMEIRNGRFGPYISYDGTNYRLPKDLATKAGELTLEQCREIVTKQPAAKSRRPMRRTASRKKA